MTDRHKRPIPKLSGTAYRHRFVGASALLPMRRPEKNDRPLSSVLAALDHADENEIAFVGGNFLAVKSSHHADFTTAEVERVIDGKQPPSALATVLRAVFGAAFWIREVLSDGSAPQNAEQVAAAKEKSKAMRESAIGKAVEAKRREALLYAGAPYSAALSSGPGNAELLAADVAMEVSSALTPTQVIEGEQAVHVPADLRDALAGTMSRTLDPQALFTTSEIASLFHPPDKHTNTHGLIPASMALPLLDPPAWIPSAPSRHELPADLLPIGTTMPGTNRERVVGMPMRDVRHFVITGRNGSGKSTLAESLLAKRVGTGLATFSIDPNSALNKGVVALLAAERPEALDEPQKKVALVDWNDPDYPVCFNLLDARDRAEAKIAALVAEIFLTTIVGQLDGALPFAANFIRAVIQGHAQANVKISQAAQLDPAYDWEKLHILDLYRFLLSTERQQLVMALAGRGVNVRFDRFARQDPKARENDVKALLHRIESLMDDDFLAHTVGSSKNAIQWKDWIVEGRTVLHSLNIAGPYKRMSRALIPALFTQYVVQAADLWTRMGEPTGDAVVQSLLALDEAWIVAKLPNAADELEEALRMSRKTGVRLGLITQNLKQMREGGAPLMEEMRTQIVNWIAHSNDSGSDGLEAKMIDPTGKHFTADELALLPDYDFAARLTMTNPRTGKREQTGAFTGSGIDTKRPREDDTVRWQGEVVPALNRVIGDTRSEFQRSEAQAEREWDEHDARVEASLRRAAELLTASDGASDDDSSDELWA
jgi:hypothetical protein